MELLTLSFLLLSPEESPGGTITKAASGPVRSLSSEPGPSDAACVALTAALATALDAQESAEQHSLPSRWHVPLGYFGGLPLVSVCFSHQYSISLSCRQPCSSYGSPRPGWQLCGRCLPGIGMPGSIGGSNQAFPGPKAKAEGDSRHLAAPWLLQTSLCRSQDQWTMDGQQQTWGFQSISWFQHQL